MPESNNAPGQWLTEEIPASDGVYMRVHETWVPKGRLSAGVFQDRGRGMSTDWDRYSTAEEARARARNPTANGIVRLLVRGVREIGQVVEHAPIQPTATSPGNRAHTDVIGEKTTEARLKLLRLAHWVIPCRGSSSDDLQRP